MDYGCLIAVQRTTHFHDFLKAGGHGNYLPVTHGSLSAGFGRRGKM